MVPDEAKPYPLDFDALKRGDVILPGVLAEALGFEAGTDKYRLGCMALAGQIRKVFRERDGDVVSVCIRGDSIAILYHADQDLYVRRQKGRVLAQFARRHIEDMGTDASKLSESSRKARDRRLLLDSWKLQQVQQRQIPGATEES